MKIKVFLIIALIISGGELMGQVRIITQAEKVKRDHEIVLMSDKISVAVDRLDSLRADFRNFSLKVNFSKLSSDEKKLISDKSKGMIRQIIKVEDAILSLKKFANENYIENDKRKKSLLDMVTKSEEWFDSVRKPLEASLEGIRKKFDLKY